MKRVVASRVARLSVAAFLALVLLVPGPGSVAVAGDLAPRAAVGKPVETILGPGHDRTSLYVKFRDGLPVRCAGGSLVDFDAKAYGGGVEALASVEGGTWTPVHRLEERELVALRAQAEGRLGRRMADPCVEFLLALPAGVEAGAACDALNACEAVEIACPRPLPVTPPVPGDFAAFQGYLDAAPGGIGALGLRQGCGIDGSGVRVCDIEYSFNASHLDLPTITLLGPAPVDPFADDNHGTAVLGEIASLDDGVGTTGGAPGATYFFAAANTAGGYNLPAAITTALGTLGAGDVILIEQQTAGPNWPGGNTQFGLVPSEWDLGTYLAIQLAVGNGVIVVEAAGNGSQDLDDPVYNAGHAPFLPGNDSGAIIVGAGAAAVGGSDVPRSRLSFSCYGSTVDLQGWGEAVMTTGYGAFYSADGVNYWYTGGFGGTSSASPIVTVAATLLQSWSINTNAVVLTPAQVRAQLQATGTPQQAGTFPVTENIGPLPDLAAAVDPTPVLVSTSLTRGVLWSPTRGLLDVGLAVSALDDAGPPPARSVEVLSNEPVGAAPYAPDATLAGSALRLRGERSTAPLAQGRIYLIVARADDACGVDGLTVTSVICPLNLTAAHLANLQANASAAVAACLGAGGAAPPGFGNVILPQTPLP